MVVVVVMVKKMVLTTTNIMMIIITMVQITTIQNRNTNSCSTVYLAQVSEIFLNVKECSLHRYLTYFST